MVAACDCISRGLFLTHFVDHAMDALRLKRLTGVIQLLE